MGGQPRAMWSPKDQHFKGAPLGPPSANKVSHLQSMGESAPFFEGAPPRPAVTERCDVIPEKQPNWEIPRLYRSRNFQGEHPEGRNAVNGMDMIMS